MNAVVVALGSNIDREANIGKACASLEQAFVVKAVSSFVVTKPLGFADQGDFLNGVALLETDLSQETLRSRLKELEAELGRRSQDNKWGPRAIDFDILIWNGNIVNKDYYERDFLRKAVQEILPYIK